MLVPLSLVLGLALPSLHPTAVLGAPAETVAWTDRATPPWAGRSPSGHVLLTLEAEGKSKTWTHGHWSDDATGAKGAFHLCANASDGVELRVSPCPPPRFATLQAALLADRTVVLVVEEPASQFHVVSADLESGRTQSAFVAPVSSSMFAARDGVLWFELASELAALDLRARKIVRHVPLPDMPAEDPGDAFYAASPDGPLALDTAGELCRLGKKDRWQCAPSLRRLFEPGRGDSEEERNRILAFAEDGRFAALANDDGRVRIVDVASRRTLWQQPRRTTAGGAPALEPTIHLDAFGHAVALFPDDDEERAEVLTIALPGARLLPESRLARGSVTALRFAGDHVLHAGDASGGLVEWDLTKRRGRRFDPGVDAGAAAAVAVENGRALVLLEKVENEENVDLSLLEWSLAGTGHARMLLEPEPPVPYWATSHVCAGQGAAASEEACREHARASGWSPAAERAYQQKRWCPSYAPLPRQPPASAHVFVDRLPPMDPLAIFGDGRVLTAFARTTEERVEPEPPMIFRPGRCPQFSRPVGFTHDERIVRACSSRDGSLTVVSETTRDSGEVSATSLVRLDPADGHVVRRFRIDAGNPVDACDLSRTGALLLSDPEHVTVFPSLGAKPVVVDARGGTLRRLVGMDAVVELSGRTLRYRRLADNAESTFDFTSVDDTPTSLELSPREDQAAVGTRRGRVFLFDIR